MMYKVVRNEKGVLCSVFPHGEFGVKYIPNEWTLPLLDGSKLYIFKDEKDARSFYPHLNIEIWECEAEEIIPFKASIYYDCRPFWLDYNENKLSSFDVRVMTKHFPSSCMTNKVKLTNRIA